MLEIAAYSLLALVGVLVVSGAIWIVARGVGAAEALSAMSELRTRITELEIAFAGFAEQYEISNVRSAAKIGKLRRKVERLEDGDDDEEEEGEPKLPIPPPAAAPRTGNDVLRIARERGMVR